MRSVFYPRLVNGPFGDPALYVRFAYRGEAILFDCGDLAALSPRELLRLRTVFISHAHIDHLVGFDLLLRLFLYRRQPLEICGPPGLIDRIEHKLAGYTWNLIDDYPLQFRIREWGAPHGRRALFRASRQFRREEEELLACPDGVLFSTPDLRVRAVPLDHGGIISLAFALEETLHVAIHKDALDAGGFAPGPWLTRMKDLLRRAAPETTSIPVPMVAGGERLLPLGELATAIAHAERGMKIVYVTDAAPSEANQQAIVELARDAHLLVIEATFADRDLERARQRGHLTARLAGELGRRAGAARLLVFHHSPRYQQKPDELAEEAQRAFTGDPGKCLATTDCTKAQ